MKVFSRSSLFCALTVSLVVGDCLPIEAQFMLSGHEGKIALDTGSPVVVANPVSDSLSFIDFSRFPPSIRHDLAIPNSVIGPPSNIAISPNGRMALVANSLKIDPADPTQWIPEDYLHIVDLSGGRLRVRGQVQAGSQPSGLSFARDGKSALVANRASGTVSLLEIDGFSVKTVGTVSVAPAEGSVSDVAIHPDGNMALVSVQKGGYLALLRRGQAGWELSERKISVYGQPYRVVISPDGRYGITAGQGYGDVLDPDAITIVDLSLNPPVVVDHITIDPGPESLEISPDGRLVAAVCMSHSNLPPGHPQRSQAGSVVILKRRGDRFVVSQKLPTGRVPEGVAFTADGRYLAVQCHLDKEIRVYRISGTKVRDTGHRIQTTAFPSSLRASGSR